MAPKRGEEPAAFGREDRHLLAQELEFADLVRFDPDNGSISFCGRRAVLVQADAMGALRKELVDTLGIEVAKVILTRYGYSCGHGDAEHLAPHMTLAADTEYVLAGPRAHMFEGVALVQPEIVETQLQHGRYYMAGKWRGSYEAEQHLRLFGPSADPVCWTLAGYASGFSSLVFKQPMICIEDTCAGRGDEFCSWRLIPAEDCGPGLDDYRKSFMPLNIKEQINVLEHRVKERTSALAASESRYRDLVDNLPEMVFSLDAEGRLVHLNRAGRDRLGLHSAPANLPLGKTMSLRDRRRVARFLKRMGRQRSDGSLEVTLQTSHGEEMPVQLQISPVIDGETLAGFRGLAVDISTRHARERQLAEYAHSLESQLQQASRLAGLGQFASGIAHEINNPMGLISGYAEELIDLLEELPNRSELGKLRRGLATIQEQAYRCRYITQNLLSFAREQVVNPEPTDLTELVHSRIAFFGNRVLSRGVEVSLKVEGEVPVARVDPVLCGQVLLNLLKNAEEAMAGPGRIVVGLTTQRDRVRIEVADTGPGIPPEILDKVFDPFFTTKGPDKGSGLGLSICYGIVRSLGGTLTCGNRPQGGAWFRVSLPLNAVAPKDDKP